MWSEQALPLPRVSSPLKGVLPPNVLEALSELEDRYSFGLLTGAQVLALAIYTETEVSGALLPGKTLMALDVPVEDPGQALMSAGPLSECSLSSAPQ